MHLPIFDYYLLSTIILMFKVNYVNRELQKLKFILLIVANSYVRTC